MLSRLTSAADGCGMPRNRFCRTPEAELAATKTQLGLLLLSERDPRVRRHPPLVIGLSGQTQRFLQIRFSHPISHRTPHYRVGNGGIRWMVISQKRPNFGIKRNCMIQAKMGCNGLGNRWSKLVACFRNMGHFRCGT
jgi:hypothetical protein